MQCIRVHRYPFQDLSVQIFCAGQFTILMEFTCIHHVLMNPGSLNVGDSTYDVTQRDTELIGFLYAIDEMVPASGLEPPTC